MRVRAPCANGPAALRDQRIFQVPVMRLQCCSVPATGCGNCPTGPYGPPLVIPAYLPLPDTTSQRPSAFVRVNLPGPVLPADASANERLGVQGKADAAARTGRPGKKDNAAMRAETFVPSGLLA